MSITSAGARVTRTLAAYGWPSGNLPSSGYSSDSASAIVPPVQARMDPFLYVHAEVGGPLEFLRGHELDAHDFLAVGDGLFKLEISRPGDRRIAQPLQHCLQLKRFRPEGNHVQNEIYVFGAACVLDEQTVILR